MKFSEINHFANGLNAFVLNQTVKTNLNTWDRFPIANWPKIRSHIQDKLGYASTPYVTITRRDIFAEQDPHLKNILAMMWGFAKGGGQSQRYMRLLFENADHFVEILSEIESMGLTEGSLLLLNKVKGVKISKTSKLLYFKECYVGGAPCLIFDRRVLESLQSITFEEFEEIDRPLKALGLPQDITFDLYAAYCRICAEIAGELDCKVDVVEYLLFNPELQKKLSYDFKKVMRQR